MVTKCCIVFAAAGASIYSDPNAWIPLVVIIFVQAGILRTTWKTSATAERTERKADATAAKTDEIAKSVDGASTDAAKREEALRIKVEELSLIIAGLGKTNQNLTSREADLILGSKPTPLEDHNKKI